MLEALRKKETYKKFLYDFKFAFYCTTHPLDGFWDLTREKRGSYAVANCILLLVLLTRLLKLFGTGFLVMVVHWSSLNIFIYLGSILLPLALWCVGNWALTTLFDGKGTLGQIYMATCYGMLPYFILQIPMIILSNLIVWEEIDFYVLLNNVSLLWAVVLIVLAMGQIHEYKPGINILFVFGTLFAMLVMIFILLLFFSMLSQAASYFESLWRELLYRMES